MRQMVRTLVGVLFALFTARGAIAATCIGPVEGVPGQPNRPPHWWDATAEPGAGVPQPVYHTKLGDARWVRAGAITYDSGVGEDALFRALHDTSNIYLSWWIKSTPVGTPEQNALYFGYVEPGGATRIVKITLATTGAIEAGGGGGSLTTVTFRRNPDPGPNQGKGLPFDPLLDTPPAWLIQTARVWVQSPTNTWAVQVRMPKTAVAMVGGSFKFWFQAYTGTVTMPVVRYTWPRIGAAITEAGFPADNVYPDPNDPINPWDNLAPSTGPLDPTCASAGVSIAVDQVGTKNTPSHRVLFAAVPPAASHPQNVFFARPRNFSGMDIPTGGIKATFRIANWGSMPNWEDGVPVSQLWAPITCGTDGSPTETACGTDVPSVGQINNGTTADATNEIRFDWALTNTQLAPFASGAKRADNCLLVELSSATTPGLTFTARSVRRNVIFAQASTFTQGADVSIKGLGPIAGGRDVYIWVETLNMPRNVDPKSKPGRIPVHKGGCGEPGARPPTGHDLARSADVGAEPVAEESVGVTDAEQLTELAAAGQLCQSDLDAAVPTYRVHVYHDTGERAVIGGVSRPILQSQGAFGYRMAHEGPLTGWRHELKAQGFTLHEIGPDFYRIEKVPTDGVVPVKTTIEAVELYRWSLSLHGGVNDPKGDLGSLCGSGASFGVDLEYRFNSTFAAELFYGHDKLDCGGDEKVDHLSANAKAYIGSSQWKPFLGAGVGYYDFSPGGDATGFNVFAGVQANPLPRLGLEATTRYHFVDFEGRSSNFLAFHLGARIRF